MSVHVSPHLANLPQLLVGVENLLPAASALSVAQSGLLRNPRKFFLRNAQQRGSSFLGNVAKFRVLHGNLLTRGSKPWRLLPPPGPCSCKCPRPSRRQSSSGAFHRHPLTIFRAAALSRRPTPPAEPRLVLSTPDMRCPSSLPQRTAFLRE